MTTVLRPRVPLTAELRDIQSPVSGDLDRVVTEMRRIVLADAPLVARVSSHLLSIRGKMLRPTLVLLASRTDGTPERRALNFAAVVELIHLATLVHDDAVDHSVLRRGLPTVNALFSHQISVIAGDFIYARSLTELVSLGDLAPLEILTRVSAEMSAGELRQLGVIRPLTFSEDDYTRLIGAKTASLMSAACEVGALAGGSRHREALREFGRSLGMAFQVVDDILDYTGEAETTGKPVGLDLREKKVTLPLIEALRRMPAAGRREVETLLKAETPEEGQITAVTDLVLEHGGLEYARARVADYAEDAHAALASLPRSTATEALGKIVNYVTERRS